MSGDLAAAEAGKKKKKKGKKKERRAAQAGKRRRPALPATTPRRKKSPLAGQAWSSVVPLPREEAEQTKQGPRHSCGAGMLLLLLLLAGRGSWV